MIERVRIYLSQDDQWEGQALYLAVLEELRHAGATGATALQGVAGFGPGQRARRTLAEHNDQHRPVVIEWVDRAERVARLLPLLEPLIREALVTIEPIPVYKATMRARSPFADFHSAGTVMRSPALTLPTHAPLSEALTLLIEQQQSVLPIVDESGHLIGLISEQELTWRAGFRLAPHLLAHLHPAERAAILAPLATRTTGEVMNREPRSVGINADLPQALITMVEWGYSQVPVIDREGHVVGLLGQDQVLREAVNQADATPPSDTIRDADPPTPVRLVMQTATAQVVVSQRLNLALAQLLTIPDRQLLVVDAAGRLVGALHAPSVLSGLKDDERAVLLAALQRDQPLPTTALPGDDRGLDGLLEPDPPAISPETSLLEAARRLLELAVDRLAVVEDDGRLLGIIARGGLIRALLQQSE